MHFGIHQDPTARSASAIDSLPMLDLIGPAFIALLLLHVVLWVWAISDCLRHREELTPILGSRKLSFGFWVLVLFAINPILLVLYALFGRRAWTGSWNPWVRHAVLFPCLILGIALQMGHIGSREPAIDVKGAKLSSLSGVRLQIHGAENSNSCSTVTESGDLRTPKTVRVSYSEDELSWQCARELAIAFGSEPWTDSVELWPRAHRPSNGGLAPELYVDVSNTPTRQWSLPFYQGFQGSIYATAASAPFPMGPYSSTEGLPRSGRREFKSRIGYSFHGFGFALGGDVIGGPAQGIATLLIHDFVEPFRKTSAEGAAAALPAGVYAPESPIELPAALLALDAKFLGWEYAPYVHSRSIYQFEDERHYATVLAELSGSLEAEGWGRALTEQQALVERAFTMRGGGKMLTIGKWPHPKYRITSSVNGKRVPSPLGPNSSAPFVITLESRFDSEEMAAHALQPAE
jgi:hypothetical protein